MESDKVVELKEEKKELCKSTRIKLLEAKCAVLESKLKEYIVQEQLRNDTNILQNKFTQFVQGVQKEYPGYILDSSFNLVEAVPMNKEGE